MADFDLIVFGGGTGNTVASAAAAEGLDTALIEKGPIGGLCLNRGCNPSKMLIQHANVVNRIRRAGEFGIDARIDDIRFGEFVREVNNELAEAASTKADTKRKQENLTLFQEEARFVDDYTIELVDTGESHTAERVVIAAGSIPVIPSAIDGLDNVDFLTSTDAIRVEECPDRLVILGGGYIAAELGYYFESFGTDVVLIEMEDSLVPREDSEVADAFTDMASERHEIYTGYRASETAESGGEITVTAESKDGDEIEVDGDELLVALGRRPNTDGINLEATNVSTTDAGFIETDTQLRTNVENIWAMGDIADNGMFKHSGDYEGEIVIDNVAREKGREANFTALPHAVFTDPQIGAVGETESALEDTGKEYVVGHAEFTDTAMSRALKLDHGFVKVLADPESREILGCHIIGHEASMLIHEVTPAVRSGVTVDELRNTLIHAHPSMNKVVMKACQDVPQTE
ncbi:dihydrolipoyl dehydrogenase family protein [Haladaptatus halobius]|uniref:dihydrolipoyl dehydrogenase family protein n=1 Tax=Haladaptatus halobius TaxID=2884875 RepID=UPI001D0B6027|nr:dihydrolipoyl dehydrogenase [Haladaptatus halobius]